MLYLLQSIDNYEFWGSNDKFDKERINYDKDLLKDYYKNGYIDFQIFQLIQV